MVAAVLALAAWSLGTGGAVASSSSFGFHVGDALLQSLGFPAGDRAIADNGDTVKVIGTGSFDTSTKSATGGGTFEHRAPNGTLRGKGTWTATRLLTFQDYGCGLNGNPNLCGGRAALAVHLVAGTVAADGILEVNCQIGSPPPGTLEGIRLNVFDLINFNKTIPDSGATVFIAG
jgi:hypothetical protein